MIGETDERTFIFWHFAQSLPVERIRESGFPLPCIMRCKYSPTIGNDVVKTGFVAAAALLYSAVDAIESIFPEARLTRKVSACDALLLRIDICQSTPDS